MMKKYCDVCDKEVGTKIVNKRETYNVLGEPIEVDAEVLVCAECGEELFSEKLDNETLLKAYSEYKVRHKLLTAEEIRSIREQYGLSRRNFGKLLNWEDKTVRRYENGSIQNKAHNSLLLFLRDPENMKNYLLKNKISLADRELVKLNAKVDQLISEGKCNSGIL